VITPTARLHGTDAAIEDQTGSTCSCFTKHQAPVTIEQQQIDPFVEEVFGMYQWAVQDGSQVLFASSCVISPPNSHLHIVMIEN
jgi:hypothetical protein